MELSNNQLYQLIYELNHYISRKSRNKEFEQDKLKSYPYIPFNVQYFVEILSFVNNLIELKEKNFIDYGCGVGLTCTIAQMMSFHATGVEYDKDLIYPVKWPRGEYILADLKEEETWKKLHRYNVVYFYSPFKNIDQEILFEINALETCKVNGYVICPPPGDAFEFKKYGVEIDNVQYKDFHKLLNSFKIVNSPRQYPILKRIK